MTVGSEAQTEALGPVLRGMRQGVGLTLIECAIRAGTDKSTLSRFERGERRPSAELLARIARVVADEAAVLRQRGRVAA